MNPKIKAKWVKALRSGEYKQTTGALRSKGAFCCLGVLCNIHAQEHPKIAAKETNKGEYLGHESFLADEVQQWSGLPEDTGDTVKYLGEEYTLDQLNDQLKLKFKKIADIIEQQL